MNIISLTAFANPDYLLWKISFIQSQRQNSDDNCAVLKYSYNLLIKRKTKNICGLDSRCAEEAYVPRVKI
jgi:hypothetical protein